MSLLPRGAWKKRPAVLKDDAHFKQAQGSFHATFRYGDHAAAA